MKFLIDEDIPAKLISALTALGHDCARATPSSSDLENAERARKESRVLLTLDKDFTNISMYPPGQYDIIRFQIHPPLADALIEATNKLLKSLPVSDIKGLIILEKSGHIRLSP